MKFYFAILLITSLTLVSMNISRPKQIYSIYQDSVLITLTLKSHSGNMEIRVLNNKSDNKIGFDTSYFACEQCRNHYKEHKECTFINDPDYLNLDCHESKNSEGGVWLFPKQEVKFNRTISNQKIHLIFRYLEYQSLQYYDTTLKDSLPRFEKSWTIHFSNSEDLSGN